MDPRSIIVFCQTLRYNQAESSPEIKTRCRRPDKYDLTSLIPYHENHNILILKWLNRVGLRQKPYLNQNVIHHFDHCYQ